MDKGFIDKNESFDTFLQSEGLYEPLETQALKEILADQIRLGMEEKGFNKTTMAQAMNTSRHQIDRLLDPANPSLTLNSLERAARVLGKSLHIELV